MLLSEMLALLCWLSRGCPNDSANWCMTPASGVPLLRRNSSAPSSPSNVNPENRSALVGESSELGDTGESTATSSLVYFSGMFDISIGPAISGRTGGVTSRFSSLTQFIPLKNPIALIADASGRFAGTFSSRALIS